MAQRLTVAVTGAAGYVATRLVRALCGDERVDRVLGFDVRPATFGHDKFIFDTVDVRNPALEPRLRGVDVVVHLAFIMNPIRDEALMRDINVNGSQNVFTAAATAGVGKIVYASSAVAYGAHPDNDFPLSEESALRANLDFSYPAHKLEVEYVVKEFRRESPEIAVTVLRPAIVFGPNVDSAWSHFLEAPVLLGVRGFRPPYQFVHEDDVARALSFAVFEDLDGNYNLAPRGWLEYEEAQEIIGRARREMSEPAAYTLLERMWKAGLAEAPAGILHYLMHPWVMSVDKLEAAGFRCEKSNAQALRETVAHSCAYVRVGRARFRRADLAKGAVAGAGLLTAAALLSVTRKLVGARS